MNEKPLVSVITPSYNHAKYIKETIESVVKQTYKNIEYFVVDDGSIDNSVEIITGLKEKYNFNFESQLNKGLAFTMNKLINKCNGKYIALVESDDTWTTDKIEKQVAFLEKNKNIAVGGHAICINERGEELPPKMQALIKYRVYSFKDIMSFDYQIFPLTVMIRRDAYTKAIPYDESLLYIDAYTWLKITERNESIVILPDLFGFYRVHESNVHYDTLKMYITLIKTIDKFKFHPLYEQAKKNALFFIFPYLAMNNKIKALSVLPQAFKLKLRTFKGIVALFVPYALLRFLTKTRYK